MCIVHRSIGSVRRTEAQHEYAVGTSSPADILLLLLSWCLLLLLLLILLLVLILPFTVLLTASTLSRQSLRAPLPKTKPHSALITSALMNNAGFADLHGRGDEEDTDTPRDLTPAEAVASVILIIFVALVFIYHYFLAWKLLPGGWLGWNLVSGQVPEDTPPPIRENRFLQYAATALIVTTYVTLFAAFAHNRGDGWDYHYVLLSWAMSLLCTFDDPISVGWLGITTGAFLQGVGAYSFRVLFRD